MFIRQVSLEISKVLLFKFSEVVRLCSNLCGPRVGGFEGAWVAVSTSQYPQPDTSESPSALIQVNSFLSTYVGR